MNNLNFEISTKISKYDNLGYVKKKIDLAYDLFENDKKIKSSKNLADLFYFPKKYLEGGATKGFCYTIGGL